MAKYFLIAGEASGDMHAASLVRELKNLDENGRFAGLGGDALRAEGVHLYQDYRKMAYMAVVAVLRHLPDIWRNFRIAKEALLRERPDALVLIDYPSFNLRMAAFCKKHLPETKIYYYIPPKAWAWKKRRVHKIAKLSDEVLGIFPFEPAFYAQYGYKCRYVGNPSMAILKEDTGARQCPAALDEQVAKDEGTSVIERKRMLAILPGSRRSEISHCLPTMLRAAVRSMREANVDMELVVAGAPGVEETFYAPLLADVEGRVRLVFGQTHSLLREATVAVVNSGTATLEAALLDCPQVAVYYLACGWIAHLRPLLFDSPYFTLPNILLQRDCIQEKIAYRFTEDEVSAELTRLLQDTPYREKMREGYQAIRDMLGTASAASEAAKVIYNH